VNNLIGNLAKASVMAVPGRRISPDLLLSNEEWEQVRSLVPGWQSSSRVILMLPSDPRRSRILVMPLESDRPLAFVKMTIDAPNPLASELLEALSMTDRSFIFPRVRETVSVGPWWVSIEDPMPQISHKPAPIDPVRRHDLVAEVQALLPRPGMGEHAPSHGDLGPWNFRLLADGRLALLDWEYAARAPVATDEMWHAITFRLSRSRGAGDSLGRDARDELIAFYSPEELAAAANHLASRWEDEEPDEMIDGVPRTKKLLAFEQRLLDALAQF
jgi:hypothetical protein